MTPEEQKAYDELLEAAEEVEWIMFEDFETVLYCPCCGEKQRDGHDEDCRLNNAIKAVKAAREE